MDRIETPPPPPERPSDGHKGTFGSVLVVAGSKDMSGAACLAGQAALHGGAGLVTVAVPESAQSTVALSHPSYMTIGLQELDGKVAKESLPQITSSLDRKTAFAIGPGLGRSDDVSQVAHELYRNCEIPSVWDADALNAFESCPELLTTSPQSTPRVLTPHPGEFARLCGISSTEVQLDREQFATRFASKHNVVLVLKGPATIICDGQRIAVNDTGNAALATGGSGDILTGLIASLMAQGMQAFEAACLGVHLHGLAGEIASDTYSDRFVTSREILAFLNNAWLRYEQSSKQQKIGFL